MLTLRSTDNRNWSVILETIGAQHPQTVSFRLAGGLATTEVHIWETNSARTFEQVGGVNPVNGEFEYTFDADSLYSLTTTTGQGKEQRSHRLRPRSSALCGWLRENTFESHTEVSLGSRRSL